MTSDSSAPPSMGFAELNLPNRNLLGPGPSNVHPRVYRAMQQPVIGYLDPAFIQLMDDTQRPLRTVFRTENSMTMAVSGTGTAGMETAIYNVVEPGDTAVVCENGFFGIRMADMVKRCGADVILLEQEWGRIIEPEQVEAALKDAGRRVKVVCIVHGETSTGVLQPLEEISRIVHTHGALLLADAVTSLAGCELRIDDWGIDVCYSGTHKRNAAAFAGAVHAMGLKLHAQEGYRLPPLTTVRVPEGIDDMKLRQGLLQAHNIEVGGGIGVLQGQVLRIGLMGYGSSETNVFALLHALETQLAAQGFKVEPGAGLAAAARSYAENAQ